MLGPKFNGGFVKVEVAPVTQSHDGLTHGVNGTISGKQNVDAGTAGFKNTVHEQHVAHDVQHSAVQGFGQTYSSSRQPHGMYVQIQFIHHRLQRF